MPDLPLDVKFVEGLFVEDAKWAAKVRETGCPYCGGPLHRADYPRKVRGVSEEAECFFEGRFSFCCGRCRKRTTPASLRFLGRRVYAGAAMLLAVMVTLAEGLAAARRAIGAALRTLRRWRHWFQVELLASEFWQARGGQFRVPPAALRMPLSLVEAFRDASEAGRLWLTLKFLKPLTCHSGGHDY